MIVRLLDEIHVVLRVSVAHQTLDGGRGNAVRRGAVAVDIDPKIRRVVVIIGADTGEAFELLKLFQQLVSHVINVLGHNPADGIGVLALGLARRADADLQHRLRR